MEDTIISPRSVDKYRQEAASWILRFLAADPLLFRRIQDELLRGLFWKQLQRDPQFVQRLKMWTKADGFKESEPPPEELYSWIEMLR